MIDVLSILTGALAVGLALGWLITTLNEVDRRLDRIERHLGISEGVKEKEPQP